MRLSFGNMSPEGRNNVVQEFWRGHWRGICTQLSQRIVAVFKQGFALCRPTRNIMKNKVYLISLGLKIAPYSFRWLFFDKQLQFMLAFGESRQHYFINSLTCKSLTCHIVLIFFLSYYIYKNKYVWLLTCKFSFVSRVSRPEETDCRSNNICANHWGTALLSFLCNTWVDPTFLAGVAQCIYVNRTRGHWPDWKTTTEQPPDWKVSRRK